MKIAFPILLLSIVSLSAQEFNPLGREIPEDRLERQVRIQVEWIEVSLQTYTELMAEPDPVTSRGKLSNNDGPLRRKVAELVKRGEAEVIETALVIARSGNRAKVESIQEFIYPTEYDPPVSVDSGTKENPSEPRTLRNETGLPTPTAFETRNVGTTLEVDPTIGADNQTVDLNLAPELVYAAGYTHWGEYASASGKMEAKMPAFYTVKVTTQVAQIAGEYGLIAVQSPLNVESGMADRKRKVLVFLKADVLLVGKPVDNKPEAPAADKQTPAPTKP